MSEAVDDGQEMLFQTHTAVFAARTCSGSDRLNKTMQAQTSPNSSIDRGGGHKTLPLAEELLAREGWSGRS